MLIFIFLEDLRSGWKHYFCYWNYLAIHMALLTSYMYVLEPIAVQW